MPPVLTDIFINDDLEFDPVEETEPDADDWTPEAYDQYLSAQVVLSQGDENYRGTVKRQKQDNDGNPVGVRHSNPILDTREYEVEFPDGSVEVLTANTIAEAMYSQIDNDGHHH
jgi:hypothetical protein